MEFNWDEFTAENFATFCSKMNKHDCDDVVGFIRVGELCCDLQIREDMLDYDIYVGGVDTGYGYSAKDAMTTGKYKSKYDVPKDELYPYDYVGGGQFPDDCIVMTYEGFKQMAEEEITDFITFYKLEDKANMKLHKW